MSQRENLERERPGGEDRYRRLLETMNEGVWILDGNSVTTYVNEAMASLLGHPRASLIGRDAFAFVWPEDLPRGREEWRLQEAEQGGRSFELRMRHRERGPVWCRVASAPLFDDRGRCTEMLGLFTDITQRKRSDTKILHTRNALEAQVRERTRALAESEERYRLLAENANDVIWTADLDLNLTYVSPAAERLSGHAPDEIAGKPLEDLLSPRSVELAKRRLQEKLSPGSESDTVVVELELLRRDGSRVWTETSATVLRNEAGAPVAVQGVTRDLTERRSLEARLLKAQKMEAMGRMTGTIAHDFKNMMHVVTGYGRRALERMETGDPAASSVERILLAAERASHLTKKLLAFSRRQTLYPEVLDLNDVVQAFEETFRPTLEENVELVLRLRPDGVFTEADPAQLEQVLVNLVFNARDAMPDGGRITVETQETELGEEPPEHDAAVPPGRYALLAVSDTGCGMDEAVKAQVFEPFFSTKTDREGTGLGLATAWGFVSQSGGVIRVYSEPDRETTFKIFLPPAEAKPEGPAPAAEAEPAPLGKASVLLVEDEPLVRSLTALELEDLGVEVIEAEDGAEALRKVRALQGPLDLVLTDVVLPGANGCEVFASIRAERPEAKVIYISGHPEGRIVRQGCLEAGISYLRKPFSTHELADKIRETLDNGSVPS